MSELPQPDEPSLLVFMTSMGRWRAQQECELALSLSLGHDPVFVPLPSDFWKTSSSWLAAAVRLVGSHSKIQDLESRTRVLHGLREIIYAVDNAVESFNLNTILLPPVSHLLFQQSLALQFRHLLLRDPEDLRRAIYILEILPQLCHVADTKLSRNTHNCLEDFLKSATQSFLCSRYPSEFTFIQLLEDFGAPSDLITRAYSVVQRASDISYIPAEVCGCTPQSPLIQEIDQVIATIDSVTEKWNPGDKDHNPIARLLWIQVEALRARFILLGLITDLDRSVFIAEIASQSHNPHSLTPNSVHRPFASIPSGDSLDNADLDKRIAVGKELLTHCREGTDTRVAVSHKLAVLLFDRTADNIIDGQYVLQLCEDTLPVVRGKERSFWLELRACALLRLSHMGQQFADLNQCLRFIDDSAGVGSLSDTAQMPQFKAHFLWNQLKNAAVAGNRHAAAFALEEIHARGLTYWEDAILMFYADSEVSIIHTIEALKQMCITHSQDEQSFKPFAVILVLALFRRYDLSGDMRYSQEALSLRSRLGPAGTYGFDLPLYAMATGSDFNGVEIRLELAEIFAASSGGIIGQYPAIPGEYTVSGQRQTVTGDWYGRAKHSIRFPILKGHEDPTPRLMRERAHLYTDDENFPVIRRDFLVQISASTDDPSKRHSALRGLGYLHASRFERGHQTEEAEQALYWYQQGIDTFGDDNLTSYTSQWSFKLAWADTLFHLHDGTEPVEYARLLRAHEYFRQFAASNKNAPLLRLDALNKWIQLLPELGEDSGKHTLEVCELALSLLEEQSWATSSPRWSMYTRYDKKSLNMSIAIVALIAGLNAGSLTKAVELMEASQALVWSQLRRLRAPLGDLGAVSPVLASRFQQLSTSLESRMGLRPDDTSEGGADPLWMNNWKLNHDMKQVIEEIRTLPGFGMFLGRRSFGGNELRTIAKDGPVVILVDLNSGHAKALVLQQDRHDLIDLPMTYAALLNVHQSLRSMTNARDDPSDDSESETEEIAEESISIVAHSTAGPSKRAGAPHRVKKRHEHSVEDLLEILWRQVVEPVLDVVSGHTVKGNGKSKAWEIPKLENRKRIWWCCLGEFSFLPIHAAGIYSGGTPICLSDFFISSYTPTLSALLDARNLPTPDKIRILAAAQPNPGGRWNKLPQVEEELREIAQVVPPNYLISLGDTNQLDFKGHCTSVKNVVEKLPEVSVLHLACHGTQNPRDPLRSAFILANEERLTIEELMKCRLPIAHTAILSACHTASNDVEQPFEAMNLSSAFMFLGFSNILATKWPMNDLDGPIIAKAVYRALFKTSQQPGSTNDPDSIEEPERKEPPTGTEDSESLSTLTGFSLARVVDDIVRDLRLVKKVPAKRWATFVHVGV